MQSSKILPHPSTLLSPHPKFLKLATPSACVLTDRSAVSKHLILAISARYNQPVTGSTKLGTGGLGLDPDMISTDLYSTVVIAVHNAGCKIKSYSSDDIAGCNKVNDVSAGVWNDLKNATA